MGRPEHAPTKADRKLVQSMAAFGIPQEDIAIAVGIAPKTLREHYRVELDTGATVAITKVARTLFNQAVKGNVAAAIFFLKARAGWRETTNVQHSGKIEGSVTDEERAERITALFEAAGARRARSVGGDAVDPEQPGPGTDGA